jgi:hypothetical protein
MPGLDPGIHPLRRTFQQMDCRVKTGNDDLKNITPSTPSAAPGGLTSD